MVNMVYALIGGLFMLAMGAFAAARGGFAERLAAGGYVSAWLASILVQQLHRAPSMPPGLAVVDLAVLMGFGGLAWRSRKIWPVWAFGFQMLTAAGHLMILARAPVALSSLYTVMNFNAYMVILCISVGVLRSWKYAPHPT